MIQFSTIYHPVGDTKLILRNSITEYIAHYLIHLTNTYSLPIVPDHILGSGENQ